MKKILMLLMAAMLVAACGSNTDKKETAAPEAEALAADCWPAPEVAENVNRDELGDLGLTPEEEDAIVAFLKTLSDGFTP